MRTDLHILHMISKNKLKKISIETNDPDVVILLVSCMPEFVSYHLSSLLTSTDTLFFTFTGCQLSLSCKLVHLGCWSA